MSDQTNISTSTYNGWTNYATWGVALVLDNDQGTYEYIRERLPEIVQSARDNCAVGNPDDHARFDFADFLKDYTEELCGLEADEDTLSLMARQVMQAGLADVNWEEIARNIMDES